MMVTRLLAVMAVLTLFGCPSNQPKPGTGPDKISGDGEDGGAKVAKKNLNEGDGKGDGKGDGRGPLVPVDGVDCAQPGCVYHGGAAAYHTCLAAGAGTCFHYGPTCSPASSCLYDPTSGGYRSCSKIVEGQCEAWGQSCEPAGKCYYNPDDGRHHTCKKLTAGRCAEYGPLCDPA